MSIKKQGDQRYYKGGERLKEGMTEISKRQIFGAEGFKKKRIFGLVDAKKF